MFAEAFLLDLGRRLALSLATDLVKGLGVRIAGGFGEPEVERALEDALAEALAASLPHALAEGVEDVEDTGNLRQHFEGLVTDFLTSEAVVAELTLLLDPRPGVFIDTRRLAESFPYERADFPDLDLERFLDRTTSGPTTSSSASSGATRTPTSATRPTRRWCAWRGCGSRAPPPCRGPTPEAPAGRDRAPTPRDWPARRRSSPAGRGSPRAPPAR